MVISRNPFSQHQPQDEQKVDPLWQVPGYLPKQKELGHTTGSQEVRIHSLFLTTSVENRPCSSDSRGQCQFQLTGPQRVSIPSLEWNKVGGMRHCMACDPAAHLLRHFLLFTTGMDSKVLEMPRLSDEI